MSRKCDGFFFFKFEHCRAMDLLFIVKYFDLTWNLFDDASHVGCDAALQGE